ncbi:MAG: LamG-like jellyroll fold domain-containing protein [Planctomycetota bacterium]
MSDANRQTLIWDYLDGSLTEGQARELNAWLRADRANQRAFLLQSAVHRHLTETLREDSAADALLALQVRLGGTPEALEASESSVAGGVSVRRRGQAGDRFVFARRAAEFFATAAAAVALTTLFFSSTGRLAPLDSKTPPLASVGLDEARLAEDTDSTAATDRVPAATVTGVLDVEWSNGGSPVQYGEPLSSGRRLMLLSGLAQLTFESGAKLLLQGPANFVVDSEMDGSLHAGKVTAVVPRRAHGFTIRTPSVEVIDLGTEFAIEVDESGASEVHVIDGEVVAHGVDAKGRQFGELTHVVGQEAVKYSAEKQASRPVRYDADKFRRELQPRLSDAELPKLPVRSGLAFWVAADQLMKLDDDGRVMAWLDLQTGDNQSAEHALQHSPTERPEWVAKGINGRPAVRFNGSAHLVTTPLETTDDQTVSLVFAIEETADSRRDGGGQVLSYNGPPHRHLTNSSQPGVLQIGDYAGGVGRGAGYSGFVFTVVNGRGIASGRVNGPRLEKSTPVLLTYRYSRSKKEAHLFVNGELHGSETAASPPAITSRKVIGRHGKHPANHFIGDLSELLIYNKALVEDERQSVDAYLMQRYGLASNQQGPKNSSEH